MSKNERLLGGAMPALAVGMWDLFAVQHAHGKRGHGTGRVSWE
jgi:hypothetical protein